ncbi:ABC transporter ATP-binding protein [Natrinema versiforme]|uniref:Molybdate/tungstate import ATP-binding protein WtpC n=1 Tax=Natrinema versiforme TaxID=88724 RepID=A0A4P8WKA0_9EURY|nr:ABC transporter ATP-binding protein [Natrinema versiforme]QCS43948.1 ABC transporter ATP-binding protein [Natrinema versiforme]
MGSTDIRLESVDISFRNEQVLEDVHLDVDEGEFCVIVGPSGCGKSTLLQSIAGLTEPDRGRVFIDGTDAAELSVQDRELGYVFQEFEDALFPHMTVGENVAFGVRQQDEAVDEEELQRKIDEMLELLAIGDTKDDPPSELSGGQQQRVELARQLIRECDTMLLDDPLADLDYKLQKQMELEIRRLHEDLGSTFVYVTHNQDQALKLADKIVVMNEGRIEQIGTPSDVYHHPKTAFVARFLGDNNAVDGEVAETDSDGCTVDTAFGRVAAENVNDAASGDTGLLQIRPVNVAIGDDAVGLDNEFEATPMGSTYMGETTEIAVSIEENDFYAIVPGKAEVGEYDETVRVGWDREDAQFFTEMSVTETETASDILKL